MYSKRLNVTAITLFDSPLKGLAKFIGRYATVDPRIVFMRRCRKRETTRVRCARPSTMKKTLIGAVVLLTGIPALFYLNFGEVGPVGFGLTVFLVCVTVLAGLGQYANDQGSKYSPSNAIIIRCDWLDKVTFAGLVWFVLGPFFGLFVSSSTALPPTETSWRWQ